MFRSRRSAGAALGLVVGVLVVLSVTGAASALVESSPTASTATTGNISIEISDSSNGNDTAYTDIVVSSEETTQQERVLQITGTETASELTVGDVSNVITLYNRGESRNGVAVELDDISNTITLYNRQA
jgi:hypothetical protein